jgi:L-cysteine/cystine lyase
MVPSLILQETHGVKVRVADIQPQDDRETILSKLEALLGPNTRLVFISHIEYTCGLRLPVREIADLVHQRGGYLLVDGAQGGGQLALNMEALDCDAYAMPGQKWLLGPEGTGALYVRKELLPEITPRYPTTGFVSEHNWEDGTVTLSPDAAGKFASATPSIALLAGMAESIAFHQEAGGSVEVETRTMDLAETMKGMLSRISGITLTCPLERELSSGLVTFAIEGWDPAKMVEALWEKGIAGRQVSDPAAVRLCTAFFNTEEEIERVGVALMEITSA